MVNTWSRLKILWSQFYWWAKMKVTQTLTWEASHKPEDGGREFSGSCIFHFIFASSGSLGWLSHGLWFLSLLRLLVSFPVNTLLHWIQGIYSSHDQHPCASCHKPSSKAPSQDPSPSDEDSTVPPTQHGFLQARSLSVPRTDLPGTSLCSAYEPLFTETELKAPSQHFLRHSFKAVNQTTEHKNDPQVNSLNPPGYTRKWGSVCSGPDISLTPFSARNKGKRSVPRTFPGSWV